MVGGLNYIFRIMGVTDISSLAGIERVGQLNLSYNEIEDITPLSGLTDLGWLGLRANNLVVLGGTFDSWTNGTYIDLNGESADLFEVDAARLNGSINIDFYTECLEDRDGDGVPDVDDGFPDDASLAGRDTDGDGLPDSCDADCSAAGYVEDQDDDNDGYDDLVDAFPLDPSEWVDTDGDGVGDNSDAYPEDPSRSSLELYEALNLVVDENLRWCLEHNLDGMGIELLRVI